MAISTRMLAASSSSSLANLHISLLVVLLHLACPTLVVGGESWFDVHHLLGYVNPATTYASSFDGDKLYDVTKQLHLSQVQGRLAAFGDFDSDSYTDLFVMAQVDGKHSIRVFTWRNDEYTFEESEGAEASLPTGCVPEHVSASDFNRDGKLDVLVSASCASGAQAKGHSARQSNPSESLRHILFIGDRHALEPIPNHFDTVGPVLVMDYDADKKPDVFGVSKDGQRAYWGFDTTTRTWIISPQLESTPDGLAPLTLPRRNAVVDLDGDCRPEMYITSEYSTGSTNLEIWSFHRQHQEGQSSGYRVERTMGMRSDLGMPVFGDFDADGTTDVLYPICQHGEPCRAQSLYVVYNDQKPLCEHYWSEDCVSSMDLCTRDDDFLSSRGDLFNASKAHSKVDIIPLEEEVIISAVASPMVIRTGDYNMDGYPDLLVPVEQPDGRRVVQLLKNERCEHDCKRRTFKAVHSGTQALSDVESIFDAAFFDIGEDGTLDILVLNGTSTSMGITALLNNYHHDAFYLKTVGLNGVCSSWCSDGDKFPDPKPVGVNHPGGVFKFTMTDLDGEKKVRHGSQLTQSAYGALETPYTIFGLGRASNYVEEFYFGMLTKESVHHARWICIIPNSQLRVFPTGETSSWVLELYLTPSNMTIWVVGVMVVTLIFLAFVIFSMWKWQKRADQKEKEKKEKLSGFSFKAL